LIAIPVTLIGAISLAASRGIIIKNPAVLEQIDTCRTFIFDKTGTLTYGKPELTEIECAAGFEQHVVLRAAASLERYSRHPLASAILGAATRANLQMEAASEISESPGQGLRGIVDGKEIVLTARGRLHQKEMTIPPMRPGLECVVLIGGRVAAVLRFRDEPRTETRVFLDHLHPRHGVSRVLLVSGDRLEEARYLASRVGIREVHAGKSPEDKVLIVRAETQREKTLFVGDGINDAPAMQAATIGVAFGQTNEIAAEAADAVILESSLTKVDELIHIGRRARSIALQSAVGGMALSIVGMLFAAAGYLPAIGGAIAQEVIDLLAVLNAIRVALPLKSLKDF
jgi:P-type E1-E2 ATPase